MSILAQDYARRIGVNVVDLREFDRRSDGNQRILVAVGIGQWKSSTADFAAILPPGAGVTVSFGSIEPDWHLNSHSPQPDLAGSIACVQTTW